MCDASGVSGAHALQVSNMAPCAPNAPHEVRTLDAGFLIVHVDRSNVLLEIPVPMLNRTILLYTEFAGLSTGGSECAVQSLLFTPARQKRCPSARVGPLPSPFPRGSAT
jgi:hypothetical protein